MKRNKYGAIKTLCKAGHKHDSQREASRCNDLHTLQAAGVIRGLEQQPVLLFEVDGRPVKSKAPRSRQARYTADFQYIEKDVKVIEDVKGFAARDFPLRLALAETLWPNIEFRVIK